MRTETIHKKGAALTVGELIEHLQKMPQGATVFLGQLDKPGGTIIGGTELVAVHTDHAKGYENDVWLMPNGK